MALPFQLRVLGASQLLAGPGEGGRLILAPGKSLAIIAYLSCAPRHSATRDQLLELFWGGADPRIARRNLRQVLYSLRLLLGQDALRTSGHTVELTLPLQSDREDFLAAIDRGDGAAAAAAYGGAFFPAFGSPGTAGFEHWADLERHRLAALYHGVLGGLVRQALDDGRRRDAVSYATRLRDAEPGREAGARLLLETLIATGDWRHAAAEADALEAALAEEGQHPEPATLAILRAARQAPAEFPTMARRLVSELIGRESEFAALVSAWRAAAAGQMRHVRLLGHAGIGKSRLMAEAAHRIRALGGRVVALRANQGERDLSWALAGDLVRALATLSGASGITPGLASTLIDLDPALTTRFLTPTRAMPIREDLPRLRLLAVAELIGAVAEEQPLALLVDDLHWADPASGALLSGLAARLERCPVLLLTAARQLPERESGPAHVAMTLRPLTEPQVADLVESIATLPEAARTEGLLADLHAGTHGSPLLLLEVLQLALDAGWLGLTPDQWLVHDAGALRAELRAGRAVAHRLERLGEDERRILLFLAVAGGTLTGDAMDRAASRAGFGTGSAVVALEAGGYIQSAEGCLSIGHDLLAERLLEAAPREEQRQAFAAVGWALARSADPAADPRHAARLLALGGDEAALRQCFIRYERAARAAGDWRHPEALAGDLVGPGMAADVPAMVEGLPRYRRWRLHEPVRRLGGVVALLLGAAVLLYSVALSQPHRMLIRRQPTLMGADLFPPLEAEVLDWLGRPLPEEAGQVRVRVAWSNDGSGVVESLPSRVSGGIASFSQPVRFERDPTTRRQLTLRLSLPGVPSVESDTIAAGVWLSIDSAWVNGNVLSGGVPRAVVTPGGAINGIVYARATNPATDVGMLIAVVPRWGDRTTNYFAAREFPLRVRDSAVAFAINLRAPATPGRYTVLYVAAMETEAQYIASGTNWVFGRPIWGDGNDVRDWPSERVIAAARDGFVSGVPWDLPVDDSVKSRSRLPVPERRRHTAPAVRWPRTLAAAVMEIDVVQPRVASPAPKPRVGFTSRDR